MAEEGHAPIMRRKLLDVEAVAVERRHAPGPTVRALTESGVYVLHGPPARDRPPPRC